MPHRQLEQLNGEIAALRKRLASEQRRISDLQTSGHTAYGYVAHLRDLETSLRLLTSKRDNLAQRQKRRELLHGTSAIRSSHR